MKKVLLIALFVLGCGNQLAESQARRAAEARIAYAADPNVPAYLKASEARRAREVAGFRQGRTVEQEKTWREETTRDVAWAARSPERAEAAQKAEQAERDAQARAEGIASAREGNLCTEKDEDALCAKRYEIASMVSDACTDLEDIKGRRSDASGEIKDSRRYGVVDLSLLEDYKESERRAREHFTRITASIKAERGRAFSPKECK